MGRYLLFGGSEEGEGGLLVQDRRGPEPLGAREGTRAGARGPGNLGAGVREMKRSPMRGSASRLPGRHQVPAYFNDNQRQRTRDAAASPASKSCACSTSPPRRRSPTASARTRATRRRLRPRRRHLRHLDPRDRLGRLRVLSTCGDTYLGGEDFDDRVIDLLAEDSRHSIRSTSARIATRSRAEGRRGVREEGALRRRRDADPDRRRGEDARRCGALARGTLTRVEFAALVSDLIQRTFKVCDEALQQANLTVRDLDGVIWWEGRRVSAGARSGRAVLPARAQDRRRPRPGVRWPAIRRALVGEEQESRLLDVTPLSLRIGVAGGLAETISSATRPCRSSRPASSPPSRIPAVGADPRVPGRVATSGRERNCSASSSSPVQDARRGEVRIEVTFEIDTDGIVKVTARDPTPRKPPRPRSTSHRPLRGGDPRPDRQAPRPAAPSAAPAETSGATLAAVASVAANRLRSQARRRSLRRAKHLRGEIEFDAEQLEAAANIPLEGPADSAFELDPAP